MRPQRAAALRSFLLRWYRTNGRDLPWRRTRDPYRILVSEFMLQQTQVATVLRYYRRWLRRFPSFAALARASESAVLHAWQGLGYYTRARNLHATAKLVTYRQRGRFPRDTAELRQLPGIGKYTAHALASFSFDQAVPIVETNTARVLSRVFNLRQPIDSAAGRAKLWDRAASLIPNKSSASYNSALIDLGALVCLPRNPKCNSCPINKFCAAKDPAMLPLKTARPSTQRLLERHAFTIRNNKLLLIKASSRWRGMWILPPLKHDRLKRSRSHRPVYESVFPFTNHRITLRAFSAKAQNNDSPLRRWFSRSQLKSIPIPSPHRRAIEQLFRAA